ncbi:MAG TPA: glycosyltransferase family 2 protein [Acidobacteriota bacterium]
MMSAPRFSVIIPTRGRPHQLAACLESLAGLRYPPDRFEVLVVRDGPARESAPIGRGSVRRLSVSWHEAPRGGPSRARNFGLERAGAELVAFTDDDCRPRPDWLERLAQALALQPDRAVGGAIVNGVPEALCACASQLLLDAFMRRQNAGAAGARFLSSSNLALPAELLRAAGSFDPRFDDAAGEDRELCARLRDRGVPLTFVPDAVVEHHPELSLAGFLRQQERYGRAARRLRRLRVRSGREPIPWQPPRWADLLRGLRPEARGGRALLIAALIAAGQAALAAGYAREIVTGRDSPA